MMDKVKLQWRIFLFMLGFCGLLLLVLWFMQTVFMVDMYQSVRRIEIDNTINEVAQNIDSDNLDELISDLSRDLDIHIIPSEFFEVEKARLDEEGIWHFEPAIVQGPLSRINTISEQVDFTQEDGSIVSYTFYANLSPVKATISTVRFQLLIISLAMISLSSIIAHLIAKKVAKPLVEINNSAKELAKNNYDVSFNGHGFKEVTELSETLNTAAKELSKVEMLRRELIANISHDLRTPIALIYSYAEMMHDFPDEVTPEQTEVIMGEATRLTTLINDLLDISKLETGNYDTNKEKYNLTKSIEKTVYRLSEFSKKDGYTIDFIYDEDIYVYADEVKITQAFYNLLLNALTHTGENKIVMVKQTRDSDKVNISISDTGAGIAKEDLSNIWQRYYKVDKTHKRAITGSGLGLSIVKNIISAHNGHCGVNSEVGKGSEFWFEIDVLSKKNNKN